jgi:chloramphenicol O-acetyltransferase type A
VGAAIAAPRAASTAERIQPRHGEGSNQVVNAGPTGARGYEHTPVIPSVPKPPIKTRIDLATYPRLPLLQAFRNRAMPCFSTTCQIDITAFRRNQQARGEPFFIALSYLLSRAVNSVPELRHRLIDDELFVFDRVDPGYTVLLDNDTFSFCDGLHFDDFSRYRAHAARRIAETKSQPDFSTGEKHHMFFITSVPWFSFTSFNHPYDPQYASIPLLTIGKYATDAGRTRLPLAIQVHHGLVDGIHVARFLEQLSTLLDDPDALVDA